MYVRQTAEQRMGGMLGWGPNAPIRRRWWGKEVKCFCAKTLAARIVRKPRRPSQSKSHDHNWPQPQPGPSTFQTMLGAELGKRRTAREAAARLPRVCACSIR